MTFRTVCGDIQLFEYKPDASVETTYYLTDKKNYDHEIGGSITKVGWGHGHVVAWQASPLIGGEPGWVIVDCRSKSVAGPFSVPQFEAQPDVADIEVMEASVAWKRLDK